MVTYICPECQAGNAPGNRFCRRCGAALRSSPVVIGRNRSLAFGQGGLPAERLKYVGQALAVSVAALLAEATITWLRRRVERMNEEAGEEVTVIRPTRAGARPAAEEFVETVAAERIVEEERWGRPPRRIIERLIVRRTRR